jgi:uncharacterized membrane protein YjjP (DUF1212 family)
MPNLAKAIGILLTLLGLLAYLLSSGASWTALIPACIGIPLFLLGVFARNEKARKHLMHAAVILTLVGFLGSVPGLLSLPALLGGEALERPGAVAAQSVMALLCLVFIVFAVRSFIQARRNPG